MGSPRPVSKRTMAFVDYKGAMTGSSIMGLAETWSGGSATPSRVTMRVPPLFQSLSVNLPCALLGNASACSPFPLRAR
jgi:hypothetical protein